ncbi:MAG: NTP transferase domain-containing protein [Acidimicrobiales bacterium]|nr:NTP transferase domain-containing protein [Acidimicrobiales bacterium]|tara:strand:+ start:742 stop:1566 length:825 start_codon:yes stop_codon:yes gene_type:complete
MDEVSLVIMAAGLGSRFGAPKQLVSVGPENEIFLDYAIKAAIEEEIKKVVIVTRSALNEQLKKHLAQYQQSNLLIEMVNQDTFEPKRKKPWGTGHAVVTALNKTDGPIIVMNADDYYGPTALRQILNGFNAKNPAILAFKLKNTLPETGSVSRGILLIENEKLLSIRETHEIRNEENLIRSGDQVSIPSDTDVSMNLWALPSKSLKILKDQWSVFIASNSSEEEAEFLLPLAIEEQRLNNQIEIDVIRSNESWVGVTNPEDLDVARSALAGIKE